MNNPWIKPGFKPEFNILFHTQSIACATEDSQNLEYLGYNFEWILSLQHSVEFR